MIELALLKLSRLFGIGQVVDARATAAKTALHHLAKLQPGDRAEQEARRLGDALSMRQVTRLLVGHGDGQITAHREVATGQKLGHVSDSLAERLRPRGPLWIVTEMVAIVLKHGATTGRVVHNRSVAIALERLDVLAREHLRSFEVATVGVQGAATPLLGGI